MKRNKKSKAQLGRVCVDGGTGFSGNLLISSLFKKSGYISKQLIPINQNYWEILAMEIKKEREKERRKYKRDS